MANYGNLFKVVFEIRPKVDDTTDTENDEKFFVEYLKIKNRNSSKSKISHKCSYTYYDEKNNVQKIESHMLDGVFIESDLITKGNEYVRAYFITDDEKCDNLINHKVDFAKGDEEYVESIKRGLKQFAEQHMMNIVEETKKQIEKMEIKDEEKKDEHVKE
ncbi:MAG: hypothetical protein BWY04_01495 [candidate division CPR1 bacterium ADurb.Bin160]|uniref:Uncharacterized protein n=1 Tax=candidate division CPR1 bacterium ADurb.Bin160 TaxID=1852826 RepID=A0A1V5ZIJ8_9BACT|nr:MAG: hypothetical protein BWY04_01495 [candidate division CPR1 bacterium ADurb.Bin160]